MTDTDKNRESGTQSWRSAEVVRLEHRLAIQLKIEPRLIWIISVLIT